MAAAVPQDRLCVQSIMASPENHLVHQVVERHGLQAIFRLMAKPRLHKPDANSPHLQAHPARSSSSTATPSPDAAPVDAGVRHALVFPLHGAPKTTTKLQSPLGDKSTATPPTVFALTDMQKRRLCGKGAQRDSRSAIAKLLREMQPIIVRRAPGARGPKKSLPSGAYTAAEQERDPSPALSTTTTTSHSSISSEAVLRNGNEPSPPPLLTARTAQPPHNGAQAQSMPVLAAVEALLALSTLSAGVERGPEIGRAHV